MRLQGKVAIVTGGAGGIGQGICRVLAAEGAAVAVVDLDGIGAEKVAADLGGRSLGVRADVTDAAAVQAMVETVRSRLGGLDVLVNNAGANTRELGNPLEGISEAEWDRVVDVNLKSAFLVSRAVLPHLKAQRSGKVVNIASVAGRAANEYVPHYCAAKAGMINFTFALARECAPHSINVNAVCPGLVYTKFWSEGHGPRFAERRPDLKGLDPRGVFDKFLERGVLRREQSPEDIGKAVAFFASDDARNITGQALNVDSGFIMY
jgi:NAD(P)-dependent dehydrogenase (short-subunit alcohol dehydrogenase family)